MSRLKQHSAQRALSCVCSRSIITCVSRAYVHVTYMTAHPPTRRSSHEVQEDRVVGLVVERVPEIGEQLTRSIGTGKYQYTRILKINTRRGQQSPIIIIIITTTTTTIIIITAPCQMPPPGRRVRGSPRAPCPPARRGCGSATSRRTSHREARRESSREIRVARGTRTGSRARPRARPISHLRRRRDISPRYRSDDAQTDVGDW